MRNQVISLSLIVIAVFAFWSVENPKDEAALLASVETNATLAESTQPEFENLIEPVKADVIPSNQAGPAQPKNSNMNASIIFSLPKAQQQEIKRLSGRDEANTQVVEVKPGVFLMSNGPKVVPVAVMNADGTVSIHEY